MTSPASERESIARALPGYDIGEVLGRGAAGVVWAARHRRMGRAVAVKQLGDAGGSELGQRFLTEARVLASLDHPHIVRVFDYVEADGVCLLIMERLTGGTVKEHLGTTDPRDACAIVIGVCAGLDYAHGRGVLHRDVKPQNLLLSAEGTVKVADFGIAKVLAASRAGTTLTGVLLGTPAYMAPEQVQGAPPSPSIDVYATGVVLYELLCGALPFPRLVDPMAELYQRVHDDPIPLRRRAPELAVQLTNVVGRALCRDSADRFADAAELGEAVTTAAAALWGEDWRGSQAATPPRAKVLASPGGSGGPNAGPSPGAAPLERERELVRVIDALATAAAGRGRLLVIQGSPGIGKTRLLEEARSFAVARGLGVLSASAHETERGLAWGIVRQLIERSVVHQEEAVRERMLAGPAGRALSELDRAPTVGDAGASTLAATLHALWWAVADLAAERPLLICVDDAQWADRPSLRFLVYLARRLADLPIALLVAARPAEAGDPAATLITSAGAEALFPRPLSTAGVAALAGSGPTPPSHALVEALHQASGGNPFHVRQLLGELQARGHALDGPDAPQIVRRLGPSTIARTVLGRLGREALALAQALAIVGGRDGLSLVADLAGLDARAGTSKIDELVAGDVLAPAGVLSSQWDLEFSHPVVREAVLAAMSHGQRAALHARAARLLAERGAAAERVAAHLVLAPAGTVPDAADRLRVAARALLTAGDVPGAVAHLRRALVEVPADVDVAAELGEALVRAGEPAEGRERLVVAARATTTPVERARRLAAAASATLALEGPPAAVAELRRHIDGGQDGGDDAARLVLEVQLGTVSAFDPDAFHRWGKRSADFAGLPGRTSDERALLGLLARRWWGEVRPAAEVAALARRALGTAEWMGGSPEALAAFGGAIHAAVMADDLAPVWRELEAAERMIREGAPRDFVLLEGSRAIACWRTGDVAGTAFHAAGALEALKLADRDPVMAAIHAVAARLLVVALLEVDDRAEAREVLEEYDAVATSDASTIPGHRVRLARAALALADDDPWRAREQAEALGAAERSAGADNPSVPWRSLAAVAAHRAGDHAAARAFAGEQLQLARTWQAPSDLGAALRVSALVEAGARLVSLHEAVEVLDRAPARLEHAYALYDLATALIVAGRESEAHAPLRRGSALARECRATVLHERARGWLAEIGEDPGEITHSAATPLTPSERRVAELVVQGRTNREIAQELFVTPRKVDSHLGHIYAKLGVSSRPELSRALSAA